MSDLRRPLSMRLLLLGGTIESLVVGRIEKLLVAASIGYKNAAKEFIWQWFFPAATLTFILQTVPSLTLKEAKSPLDL